MPAHHRPRLNGRPQRDLPDLLHHRKDHLLGDRCGQSHTRKRQDGREVVSKRMKKAIPAEMAQLAVKAGNLRRIGALEVSVE